MADIRTLRTDDYETLHQLEAAIFGQAGYPLVGTYYLRLCTELYAENCFLAFVDGRPVGYILTFVNDAAWYSTRIGVIDQYQGSSAALQLIAATVAMLVKKNSDVGWFTVKPDNLHARKLYKKIGAIERGTRQNFFTAGDELIFLEMDRAALQRFNARYELDWKRHC